MVFSALNALFLVLSAPLSSHGVAVNHFNLGARALAALGGGVPLRIMPLGASITWGQASSDGNGYRDAVRTQLTSAGNPVNMVGNRQHGSMRDNDVEGWPGFRIEQVHQKAATSVPQWKPNVILVNAGTNDALQNKNVSSAGERMESMLNDLYGWSPRAVIFLSTLIVNRNGNAERDAVAINVQLTSVAQKFQAAGRRLLLVNMRGDTGPQLGDLADDTHPNDVGYRKMANIWLAALLEASDAGLLQRPEAASISIPDDGGS
ncbi:carbohydrate esterase family 3 protein [Lasiosphaeria ovina]|uniref:Carbohydrate esterase family 3 protein n=1 Tax=Lasiosphaeria ovina TaxID=92902 RepID=A0AAE0KLK8_9PEZI|nr:carbohydrate esterase family 3 protein [Lasiosphaeria ovina]